ncbi:NAD(P)/FAD-dependent oxidoreductase [Gordonia zhaorongruii]|uniref:NAD(P)/FAD-dependent oxidoreductase n=1 Tax=Gordonia zhaorongruii TaxID=2597659 RepID=UPI00104E2280|nr:NAD(P)/FAD-dependent oxidoreductase [Gordonia zhaorongruii]
MRTTDAVIIGSGFGGLAAAKQLSRSDVETTLISATDEHLFQPLLYQVATGVLVEEEIAPPIAEVLASKDSVSVQRGYVTAVDAEAKVVTYRTDTGDEQIGYRNLIVAGGVAQGYFGHDEWADRTFSLKSLDDAIELRAHLLDRFEAPVADRKAHTFVVVGGGATGVEVAGQIRELGTRYFTDAPATVHLVEGAGELLPVYGGKLSSFTRRTLEESGIDVHTDTFVTDIDAGAVTVRNSDGDEQVIEADTIVWSAGMQANDLSRAVAAATHCETDRAGRLLIDEDLTVGDRDDVFAIGDMTSLNGYPGQSPVAMQEGRHAADVIRGRKPAGTPFAYLDKGSMAVVNRHNAVVDAPFGVQLTGVFGWIAWLAVHLFYLVGFRNRIAAVASWFRSFAGRKRPGFAQAVERQARSAAPGEQPGRFQDRSAA